MIHSAGSLTVLVLGLLGMAYGMWRAQRISYGQDWQGQDRWSVWMLACGVALLSSLLALLMQAIWMTIL